MNDDYMALAYLEQLAEAERARKAQLNAEMGHDLSYGQSVPAGINFGGAGEKLARGVYRGPGEVAGLFDIAADYSPLGQAVQLFSPTDTTLKSTVDELMGLAAVEEAYNQLAPAGGYPIEGTLQGDVIDFGAPMVSDPLMVFGVGREGAEMAGKGTREVLNWLAENAAGSPMAAQRTGKVTAPGMVGPPTQQQYSDALTRRAEAMFEPKRGPEFGIGAPQRGMIGGPQSPLADLDALEKARTMKADGVDADKIYADTGWWLDHPDGVPRFETDDSATQLLPINEEQAPWLVRKPSTSGNEEPLGAISNVLDAPGAYSAYPDLADIRFRGLSGGSAAYSPPVYPKRVQGPYDDPKMPDFPEGIEANVEQIEGGGYKKPGETKEMMLHELQHAIQERENMAKGGSPSGAPVRKDLDRIEDDAFSWDWYNRLAGEVEARSAARRANMTAEERAADPFWKQQAPSEMGPDVPYDDQIIKMNSRGPAESIGTAKGSRLGETGAKRDTSPIITPDQLGEGVQRGKRISTGSATDVQAAKTGFHSRDDMNVGLEEMRENPKAFKVNMDLIRGYPSVPTKKRAPDAVAAEAQELFAANLDYLLDLAPGDFAPRSGNWYKGANALANDITNAYDVPIEASSAVLARLSPGMDWLQNVEQADRLVSVWRNNQDTVLTPAAYKRAQELNQGKDISHLQGKRLGDLSDSRDKAIWIRSFDETENPARTYLGLTPEGATTSTQVTKAGEPKTFMWQSNDNLAKAIEILDDPSTENISRSLGKGHKIRNFYNNIADPLAPGDVTADTHAVSAAHLTPFSQKSVPVGHNFGGGAVPGVIRGAAQSGQASGTYGLYADAYRQAAEARGILPQAMQSPTWELIRENFPATGAGKANLQAKIEPIWKMVAAGRITPEQAREQIIDLATRGEGLTLPEWYGK